MARGICEYCKLPVQNHEKAAWMTSGYEVERLQGGANQILGRKRDNSKIWHAEPCIKRYVKHGDQESLFEGVQG